MVQLIRCFPAQIQTDASGVHIFMPVVTCKSTFKDSRQIFRCDTDSGVRDGQNLRVRINRNRDLTGNCVFEGIGQQLLQNEK